MTTILCGMRRNRRIDDPRSPRISLSTAILTVCACTLGPPAMASPQAVAQPASEALDVEIDRLALEAQGDLVTWRRRLVNELRDRPEGYVEVDKLVVGRRPIRPEELRPDVNQALTEVSV